MRKLILSFGETLWDVFPSGPVLGGAPLNLAYRLNSLGDRAIIVTRLGRDEYGARALDQIAALGMESIHVQANDVRPTGTVQVTLDDKGNPDFQIVPGVAYDFIEVTGELLELATTADCFCFGTLAQRSPASRHSLLRLLEAATRSLKFLDLNLRKDCFFRETISASLKAADVVKMNLQEAHYLAELFEVSLSSLPDFCADFHRSRDFVKCGRVENAQAQTGRRNDPNCDAFCFHTSPIYEARFARGQLLKKVSPHRTA